MFEELLDRELQTSSQFQIILLGKQKMDIPSSQNTSITQIQSRSTYNNLILVVVFFRL